MASEICFNRSGNVLHKKASIFWLGHSMYQAFVAQLTHFTGNLMYNRLMSLFAHPTSWVHTPDECAIMICAFAWAGQQWTTC